MRKLQRRHLKGGCMGGIWAQHPRSMARCVMPLPQYFLHTRFRAHEQYGRIARRRTKWISLHVAAGCRLWRLRPHHNKTEDKDDIGPLKESTATLGNISRHTALIYQRSSSFAQPVGLSGSCLGKHSCLSLSQNLNETELCESWVRGSREKRIERRELRD